MLAKIIRKAFLFIIGLIKYVPFGPAMALRNLCYRMVLKGMGRQTNIADAVTIADPTKVRLGSHVSIHEYTFIGAVGEVTIGDYVMIAAGCSIISESHNYSDKARPIKKQGITPKPVTIGSDVWIGCNSVILGGVTIGDGAIIGAGSVVTKDIPQHAVAVGVPCEVKKER